MKLQLRHGVCSGDGIDDITVLFFLRLVRYQNDYLQMYTTAMEFFIVMKLLGFGDDVPDLEWRYKLILPLFATLLRKEMLDLKWRYSIFLPLVASLTLLFNYKQYMTLIFTHIVRPLFARIAQPFGDGTEVGESGRLVCLVHGYFLYMPLL